MTDKVVARTVDMRLHADTAENRARDDRYPCGRKLCQRCGRRWTANLGRICTPCLDKILKFGC